MRRIGLIAFMMAGMSFLTGCGSNEVVQEATSFPVESVFSKSLSNPSKHKLITTVEGVGVLSVSNIIEPQTDTLINGERLASVELSTIIAKDGQILSEQTEKQFFNKDPFSLVLGFGVDSFSEASEVFEIPDTATDGQGGTYAIVETYADKTKKVLLDITVYRWSVTQANERTAWVCSTKTVNYVSEQLLDTDFIDCIGINPNSEVLGYKSTLTLPTKEPMTLTFVSE